MGVIDEVDSVDFSSTMKSSQRNTQTPTAGGPKPQPSSGSSQSTGGSGQAASASACFQTIIGHGGSIIAMAFISKV
jgi:hypothetical protein